MTTADEKALARYEKFRGLPEFAEGEAAANAGRHYNDACPYEFKDAAVSLADFDGEPRRKLRAWFAGWYIARGGDTGRNPVPARRAEEAP